MDLFSYVWVTMLIAISHSLGNTMEQKFRRIQVMLMWVS